MDRRYDRYLVTKYAPLYRDRYADMRSTVMCWGFDVGNGWFNIIDALSWQLTKTWITANDSYQQIAGRVGQLKYPDSKLSEYNPVISQLMIDEKYELVQQSIVTVPVAVQVKEKYATLRFYVRGATPEQYSAIDFAESLSAVTCEVCGNRGRRIGSGWLVTRCPQHYDK